VHATDLHMEAFHCESKWWSSIFNFLL